MIEDKGVTDEFRAVGVFPTQCPVATVDEWVEAHGQEYDFNKVGWPAWYPTRTLQEWQKARETWEPWVFRSADDPMQRPNMAHASNRKKAKAGR